jgi:hypothetical protein
MFSMRFWDSFGSPGVSCVKLPAAVAFPTDGRLLQRIEASRRALPANNMKPLWKSRELAVERFPARVSFPQPVHIAAAIDHEMVSRAARPEAGSCVVPLARVHGSMARARNGISVSAV